MCLRLKTHVCMFHIYMKQYVAKHRASKYVSRDLNNIIIVFIFITHQPNFYASIGTICLLKIVEKSFYEKSKYCTYFLLSIADPKLIILP